MMVCSEELLALHRKQDEAKTQEERDAIGAEIKEVFGKLYDAMSTMPIYSGKGIEISPGVFKKR